MASIMQSSRASLKHAERQPQPQASGVKDPPANMRGGSQRLASTDEAQAHGDAIMLAYHSVHDADMQWRQARLCPVTDDPGWMTSTVL
eukprot:242424-Chlamydomonas_euryale.AAC.9